MGRFNPQLRVLGHVPRWTIVRTIQSQSVAEHSYFVAKYAAMICEFLGTNETLKNACMLYALDHDIDEMISGDVPSPFKKAPGMDFENAMGHYDFDLTPFYCNKNVTEQVVEIVRAADLLDAAMFLQDEIAMGNTTVIEHAKYVGQLLQAAVREVSEDLYAEIIRPLLQAKRQRLLTEEGLV